MAINKTPGKTEKHHFGIVVHNEFLLSVTVFDNNLWSKKKKKKKSDSKFWNLLYYWLSYQVKQLSNG